MCVVDGFRDRSIEMRCDRYAERGGVADKLRGPFFSRCDGSQLPATPWSHLRHFTTLDNCFRIARPLFLDCVGLRVYDNGDRPKSFHALFCGFLQVESRAGWA